MKYEQEFVTWAPDQAHWAQWAKPVLFASTPSLPPSATSPASTPAEQPWRAMDVSWVPDPREQTAIVVNLPGEESVAAGLALANRGYRPVPLYNACAGPSALVDVEGIMRALLSGVADLRQMRIRDDAPPAFMLDASRMKERVPKEPGKFDNRWIVFPQDFPSASHLRSRGIGRALVVQRTDEPQEDLAHVLLRWQEGGIALKVVQPEAGARARDLRVHKPKWYRNLWYRALAMSGLHRANVGGFGAVIPIVASGAG